MGFTIQFSNSRTNALENVQGTDGRQNVSARADARAYYRSRDNQSVFTLSWEDASSADGDFVAYWKNTADDGRHLVISKLEMHSEGAAHWILHTGNNETASGGVATTPFCMNAANPRTAPATARTADSSTIATVTANLAIARVGSIADAMAIMEFNDTLRLGQDQSILLEMQETSGTPDKTWGTIYGYYELP